MSPKTRKLIRRCIDATSAGETPAQTQARYQGTKQAFLNLPRSLRAAYLARIELVAKVHAEKTAQASAQSA